MKQLSFFLLGALLVAGCLQTGPTDSKTQAPSFSFQDVFTQETVSSDSLKGKPVLLQAFASWCTTCIQEAQTISKFKAAHPDVQVVFVDVQVDETPRQIRGFMQYFKGEAKWVLANQNFVNAYKPLTLEYTALLSADGVKVYEDNGFSDVNTLNNALEA